jgi:hypothetical protein
MSKFLTASQWSRLDPSRKPEAESFTLSSKDGGDVVKVAPSGAVLRRAA